MSTLLKLLLALGVALPLAAFVAGSLVSASDRSPTRERIIIQNDVTPTGQETADPRREKDPGRKPPTDDSDDAVDLGPDDDDDDPGDDTDDDADVDTDDGASGDDSDDGARGARGGGAVDRDEARDDGGGDTDDDMDSDTDDDTDDDMDSDTDDDSGDDDD